MTNKAAAAKPRVSILTGYGNVIVELFADKAPLTVENFLRYVSDGFYDHTLIHRVIDNFLIQGGGFEVGMIQKTTRRPIQNEARNSLRNDRGAVAMARLSDDPHSATSQFFINTADNDLLNQGKSGNKWGYCVFANVTSGMEAVEKIEGIPTTSRENHQNIPIHDVYIEKVTLLSS